MAPAKKSRAASRGKKSPTVFRIPWFLRRKILLLVLGLAITAAGFHVTKGRVVRVTDGDTLVVHTGAGQTERIRLYGVDAPETGQEGGTKATAYASRLLLFQSVALSVVDKDQYGRSVALVRLEDGRIANEELVREGHAWVYRDYCREAFCAQWLALEHRARKEGKGLWRQTKAIPPWQWRRMHARR